MTEHNGTAHVSCYPKVYGSRAPHLTLVQGAVPGRVSEESGEYHAPEPERNAVSDRLNAIAVETQRYLAGAQITCLLKIASLLESPEATDSGRKNLMRCANDIRAAATALEDIIGPLADTAAGVESREEE